MSDETQMGGVAGDHDAGSKAFAPGVTPPEGLEHLANKAPAPVTDDKVGDKDEPAELILGKFKSPEELAKAYQELEKKQSQGGDNAGEAAAGEDNKDDADAVDPARAEVAEALKSRGLDIAEFTDAIAKDGKLSDDHYAKLAAAGYPKAMVDNYLAGQAAGADPVAAAEANALVQADVDAIMGLAGGAEGYKELLGWARGNLSKAEVAEFDAVVGGQNATMSKLAVEGLIARRDKATGTTNENVIGGEAAGRGDVYESRAQQQADMSDPRYKPGPQHDPAWVRHVQAKSIRSWPRKDK